MNNNNQTERVSDEELDQMILKLERDGMTPKQLSLMRELREVRRAKGEPVAWRYRYVHTPKSEEHGSHFTSNWKLCDSEDECNPSDCFERQALFSAPPAPTARLELVDLLSMAASAIEDLLEHTDPNTNYYSGVWADVPGKLRAATLNHSGDTADMAEPVSNRDELKKGLAAIRNSGIAIDGEKILAERDVLNSPATPDGWIPVSERMPGREYVIAADISGAYYPPHLANTQVGIYADWFEDGNPSWDDGDGNDLHLKQVTHWMPLPAAPKDVHSAFGLAMARYGDAMQKLAKKEVG